jgi:hypothetical protein
MREEINNFPGEEQRSERILSSQSTQGEYGRDVASQLCIQPGVAGGKPLAEAGEIS